MLFVHLNAYCSQNKHLSVTKEIILKILVLGKSIPPAEAAYRLKICVNNITESRFR